MSGTLMAGARGMRCVTNALVFIDAMTPVSLAMRI